MPRVRTQIALWSVAAQPPAAGVHDPDRATTYLFDEMLSRWRRPLRTIVIGRDKSCDIVVRDGLVSRAHIELSRQKDGSMIISDLESTNGIFVDGHLLREPIVLRLGMEIQIGGAFLFTVDRHRRFPITATTAAGFFHKSAKVYGNNALAGERIGVSRETVRRRAIVPLYRLQGSAR